MIPISASTYAVAFGTKTVSATVISNRAPGLTDVNYPIGQRWINTVSNSEYTLTSFSSSNNTVSATWTFLGAGAGDLNTITTDDSTIVTPTAGTILFHGTANQLVTTGSNAPGAMTIALASTLIAPGTLEVTGLLTTDAGITASGGAITLNSGTNAIAISNDASATTLTIGTGAAAKTVTIGSTNSTSTTTIASGTGGVAVGTSANAHTSTFGSTTSTSATTIQSGSGALNITSTNGAMTLASGTGEIDISADAAATTVKLGTGAGVKAVTVGSTNSTSATTVQSGSGALNITSTNGAMTLASGTGEVDISADAAATTVKLGTGAGAKTVTVGSTNTTSTTTVQSGTGGIALNAAGAVSVQPATNSAAGVSLTVNGRVFQATFTGQTTASGASQAFAITNSAITGTTQAILVSADNLGSNDAQMTITRVLQAASTLTVTLKNNGAAALNGDVHITGWILN